MRLTRGRPHHEVPERQDWPSDYIYWDEAEEMDPLYPKTALEALVLVPIAAAIFLAFLVGIGLVFVMLSPAPQ